MPTLAEPCREIIGLPYPPIGALKTTFQPPSIAGARNFFAVPIWTQGSILVSSSIGGVAVIVIGGYKGPLTHSKFIIRVTASSLFRPRRFA